MFLPQIDVCERPDEIVILVEMPGISRKEVTISWKEHVLIISGQKQQQPEAANARYLCVERNYGAFRREIAIGIPIDYKQARAELKNGLMKIHLPKVPTQKAHDTIPIE
jgi:HSP20 family protein